MVIAGHPIYTEEMDGQRSRQRDQLLHVQAWWVTRVAEATPVAAVDTTVWAWVLELELRRQIDELSKRPEIASVLDRMRIATRSDALASFLNNHEVRIQQSYVTEDLASGAFSERSNNHVRTIPDDSFIDLALLVSLSLWADDVASDDYADPRVKELRTQQGR